MSMRLIDANELFEDDKTFMVYDDEFETWTEMIPLNEIAKAPTIDAVPVVRCKGCIHRDKSDRHWCNWWMRGITLDGFCYHGKGEQNEKPDSGRADHEKTGVDLCAGI